jgi:hypothetical protein
LPDAAMRRRALPDVAMRRRVGGLQFDCNAHRNIRTSDNFKLGTLEY